jgi:hypothetical protein
VRQMSRGMACRVAWWNGTIIKQLKISISIVAGGRRYLATVAGLHAFKVCLRNN